MKTPKILKDLFKSKQETEEVLDETLKEQEMEKSFDEALTEVDDLIKGKSDGEDLNKAKKGKKKFPPKEEEEEEEEEDEDYKKSFDEVTSDEDLFVDAEPIIKSLMDEVKGLISVISERLDSVEAIQKAHAGLSVSQGKLLKSLRIEGDTPVERKSKITPQGKEFAKSEEGADAGEGKTLEKAEATARLYELIKSKKIQPRDVALIEGRIQQNKPLPAIMFEGFENEKTPEAGAE